MRRRVEPAARPKLERRISKHASRFDIGALLVQLDRLGIAREDVVFKGNPSPVSGPGIIESVRFFEAPSRRAEVVLNLGLGGPNGLVPSYFHEVVAEARDPEILETFLHFLDHPLLDAFVDALYPEHPSGALSHFESLRDASFAMLGPGSVATLEWIVSLLFPELRVRVTRASIPMPTDAFAVFAGQTLLDGSGVLGVVDAPHSAGLRVDLFAEEEETSAGRKWIDIVEARLHRFALPLLRPYALTLKVVFNVLEHSSWARLEERADPRPAGHLGYDRIEGGEGGHQVVVFEGAAHADAG